MTTVGFIGLGIMGGPMAANLVKAGFDVIGYNRSPEPIRRLVEQGGRGADSLADAVRDADVVVTMVPDSPDVEAVALGDDGIYAKAKPGTLHLDMSSIRPDVAKKVGEAGKERGMRVLDAPVSGAPRYPLRTAADAVGVIDRVAGETGVANLGFLCDLYHLAVNGDDLDQAIAAFGDRVTHVQIADAPGRHEPGTGTLDLDRYLARLAAAGYDGWDGLEYKPSGASADSFAWLPRGRRGAA